MMWHGIVNNAAHALSHPGLTRVAQGLLPKTSGIAAYAAGGPVSGYAAGGPTAPTPSSGQDDPRMGVIADAEDSLGDIEDGQPMNAGHVQKLQRFHDMFGPAAMQALHANVKQGMSMRPRQGRLVMGAGGAKSDSVPARVDNVKQAKLSTGEFVMPVDAVHGAGQGDPILGAQRLQALSSHLASLKPQARMKAQGAVPAQDAAQAMGQTPVTPSMQPPLNVEQVG